MFTNNNDTILPEFQDRTDVVLNKIEVSLSNVEERLSRLDGDKAQGFDGINPMVLKNCAKSWSKPIYNIISKSFKTGTVPKEWRMANVSPIHKSGSKMDAGNYRPVSLTSVVCKVMEGIIRDAVMEHLITNNLLSDKQHGFVNKRACITNLLAAQDIISQAINDHNGADILYTDFAKAFDKVSHNHLIHKIKAYGIRGTTLAWIEAFLKTRKQRIVMGEAVSDWVDVLSGVPQGSVLGSLLFIIFINDLPDELIHEMLIYADDS